MNDTQSVIEKFDFRKVGEITLGEDETPRFNLTDNAQERGVVYLWVEVSSDESRVVYVGKAGGTLRERCRQHAGGFIHGNTGQAHAERIRQGIADDKKYVIYARESPSKTIVGERDVSMASVEELAFIKKFNPSWNSAS